MKIEIRIIPESEDHPKACEQAGSATLQFARNVLKAHSPEIRTIERADLINIDILAPLSGNTAVLQTAAFKVTADGKTEFATPPTTGPFRSDFDPGSCDFRIGTQEEWEAKLGGKIEPLVFIPADAVWFNPVSGCWEMRKGRKLE